MMMGEGRISLSLGVAEHMEEGSEYACKKSEVGYRGQYKRSAS